MKRVYIDDDEFVWHVLTESEACYLLDCGMPVHVVNDDGDRKLSVKNEIQHLIRTGETIATPVGYINDKLN